MLPTALAALLAWSPAVAAPGFATFEFPVMATVLTVSLPDRPGASAAAAGVAAEFQRVEDLLSEWKPGSPLARVNAAAGGPPVAVDPEVLALIAEGLRYGALTDGAFDVTWAALWGLWDFRAAAPVLPARDEVARRTALVDYRQVQVDAEAGTVRLPVAGMVLGLGRPLLNQGGGGVRGGDGA